MQSSQYDQNTSDRYTRLSQPRSRRRAEHSFTQDADEEEETRKRVLSEHRQSRIMQDDDQEPVRSSRRTWPRRQSSDDDLVPSSFSARRQSATVAGDLPPEALRSATAAQSVQYHVRPQHMSFHSQSGTTGEVPALWRSASNSVSQPPPQRQHSTRSTRTELPRGAHDPAQEIIEQRRRTARDEALRRGDNVLYNYEDESWRRRRQHSQPVFRDPRLNLDHLAYTGFLPRLIYTWMPLIIFWHVVAQLFLDFNALYVLISIAVSPQSTTGRGNTEWIAAGGYIASTVLWLVVVVFGYEFIWSYRRLWGRSRRPLIEPLYLSAARFKYAAARSYSYFGFLNHVRLQAWRGPTWLDGPIEQFYWWLQNWPTAVTLAPRMALTIAVLLEYTGTPSSAASPTRDGAFFDADGQLTNYAAIVLLVNAAWAAWRIGLVLLSALLFVLLQGPGGWKRGLGCGGTHRRRSWMTADDDVASSRISTPPDHTTAAWAWRYRTSQRVQSAVEFCSAAQAIDEPRLTMASERESVDQEMIERQSGAFSYAPVAPESPQRRAGHRRDFSSSAGHAQLLDNVSPTPVRDSQDFSPSSRASTDSATICAVHQPVALTTDDPRERAYAAAGLTTYAISSRPTTTSTAPPEPALTPTSEAESDRPITATSDVSEHSAGQQQLFQSFPPPSPRRGSELSQEQLAVLQGSLPIHTRPEERLSYDDQETSDGSEAETEPSGLQAITEVDEESLAGRTPSESYRGSIRPLTGRPTAANHPVELEERIGDSDTELGTPDRSREASSDGSYTQSPGVRASTATFGHRLSSTG